MNPIQNCSQTGKIIKGTSTGSIPEFNPNENSKKTPHVERNKIYSIDFAPNLWRFVKNFREYPKVCVNLQTDVR